MWLGPAALVAWLFVCFAPLGFNPIDDGYVLAQVRRVLHGQVPHRDFVSPRPVGSALLHVVDVALPLSLFDATRLVALVQFAAYSLLFARLVFASGMRSWGVAQASGAALSMLVNLHTFPIMAWYTVDGLTLVAAGMALLEIGTGRDWLAARRLGLIVLGAAGVTKQSFLPALVLGLGRIVWATRQLPGRRRAVEITESGLLLAVPSLGYVGVVAACGGLEAMRAQLGAARPVYGLTVFAPLMSPLETLRGAPILGLFVAILAAVRLGTWVERGADRRLARWASVVGLGLRVSLSYIVLRLVLSGGLLTTPAWGLNLVWALGLVVIVRACTERCVDGTALLLVATAWMTTLSWGYPAPNLVAGSVALCLLHRIWLGVDLTPRPAVLLRVPLAVGLLAAALVVGRSFSDARKHFPYFDAPAERLTVPLGAIAPAFGRVRTNPVTARYISDVVACVRRFPARWVAVIPDNAALYPVLGLDNPFPADWMYPPEIVGSEGRILATAERLDRKGDYLVMIQTVAAPRLRLLNDIPPASARSTPLPFRPLMGEILGRLHGERVACGSFVAVYRPGRAPRATAGDPRKARG